MKNASIGSFTGNTTVDAGAKSVTFIFSSDFAGKVGGVSFDGTKDASIDFPAPNGETLGPIDVIVSAGTVRIAKVA
jgi:hypothetical protein